MFWTSVPETAVHKNCEPQLPENEIWLACHLLMPPPAGDTMRAENF
jgi:hypothetical protein